MLPTASAFRRTASAALVLLAFAAPLPSQADALRLLGYVQPVADGTPTYYFPRLADWQQAMLQAMAPQAGEECRVGDQVAHYTLKASARGVIRESDRPEVCNHVETLPMPLWLECFDCAQPVQADRVVRQSETDYVSPRFPFVRSYASDQAAGPLGPGWRSSYHRGVRFDPSGGTAMVELADGGTLQLSRQDDDRYTDDDGSQLVRDRGEWMLLLACGGSERFGADGLLLETTAPGGYGQRLDYQGALVATVRDSFGATFRFEYVNGLLARAVTPTGASFDYTADARGNLAGVIRPDGSRRSYVYGHAIASLLTSVDDDGRRFRTFAYDAQGRATASAFGDGSGRSQLEWVYPVPEFSGPPGSRPIPSELKQADGEVSRRQLYPFFTARGAYDLPGDHPVHVLGEAVLRPAELYRVCPAAASCPGLYERRSYDERGHLNTIDRLAETGGLAQALAIQGRDPARPALPLQVTEAAGTPLAKTTRYSWHPQFALPTAIVRPGQTETLSYDAAGLTTSRTLTDPATGARQEWRYDYGSWGTQVGVTDPAKRFTRNVHDANANLGVQTDPAGNITRYTDYDLEGRPGKIVLPDGVTVVLGYDKRGRQNLRDEGGLVTRTDYTADGQVARLATPDGRVLSYGYDSAHRPISVDDNVGGRLEYQRDGQGRIARELLKDNSGDVAGWTEVLK